MARRVVLLSLVGALTASPALAHPTWPEYRKRALNRADLPAIERGPLDSYRASLLEARKDVVKQARRYWKAWDRRYQRRVAKRAEEAASTPPVASSASTPSGGGNLQQIVCSFAWDCATAMRVVLCESGGSPSAVNGQYLGAWQMGSNERATYGHGSDLYSQTAAAFRYYSVSGWSPWSCY